MGKTRGVHETTPELRNRMVGMYEAGLGLREIAAAVNCSQRTVKRWLNRFDKEGTVETRERCGRKRATTSEQDEAIIRLATQTPITAAKAVLPALGLNCSVDTIRERLHKAGIHNWSPSRKHMQRIPLGNDGDGATIQQAVWRPTGTQLGKKKLSPKDPANKSKKSSASASKQKKQRPVKVRARDVFVGDGAPADALKQPGVEPGFVFSQQNVAQQPPPVLPQGTTSDMQVPSAEPLPNNQTQFENALSIVQPQAQVQPQVYEHHPDLNVAQNWPLDLVQGSHHYPQGQPHSMNHEQPPPQQQLQELHTQREQEHQQAQRQVQQQQQQQQAHQQHMQEQRVQQQQQQLQSHHHHQLEQHQPHQMADHQVQQQLPQPQISSQADPSLPTRRAGKIMRSNSCSNSSSSNDQMSDGDDDDLSKDGSREDCEESSSSDKRKKKGGKAKGTLETSVEIRNRMIGMSEAGLSTLSIALAINRSERTVKRWLERWNKEGNVQTKERKGRRRITTKEQDDAIIAMATQHPLTAAKHVAPALGLQCSVDTIRERLHKAGIHSWKLGKKQGEGNAVHTVHLWQPSGNRPNKPKLSNEKRKKPSGIKKRVSSSTGVAPKRAQRKQKNPESTQPKIVAPTANMIPAESATMQFHDNGALASYVPGPEMMQSVHNLTVPPPSLVPQPPGPPPPPGPQPMQAMGPIMQQRPDCRMAAAIAPPGQANPGVAYPSCMVSNNSHAAHMEQPDPLNYEPYIWSF